MRTKGLSCIVLLIAASSAAANPLNWGWVDVSSLPPRGPVGGAGTGPANISQGAAPSSPQNGDCFYYMIDNGQNSDTNGGGASHFDPEGQNAGSFQGQAWTQWQGLITGLKSDADSAFGSGAWTINRIWIVYDQASFTFGTGPGLVSFSEVSGLNVKGGVADWGDKTQANVENGGNGATQLPAGYHGFQMGPTTGGGTNESFLLLNKNSGPQAFPSGSAAFALISGGGGSAIFPNSDTFTIYLAPIDDMAGGQGASVALSYDGFLAGTFGFSPILLFEVCMQPPVTSNNIPVADNLLGSAPYSGVAGTTCSAVLTASDQDFGDTLTFTIASPGSLGGTLVASGPATNDGAGNWSLPVTYTIPAGARGLDHFTFFVNDGSNNSNTAVVDFIVRGGADVGAVAFGASAGNPLDTMRLYNGNAVPNGGTEVNILGGAAFAQSAEFDNLNGVRHNPQGNLLALNFGSSPNGPGTLIAYKAQPSCADDGGATIFTFESPSVITGPTRVVGLSVSPDNTKLAVFGVSTLRLYILNYDGTVDPATATLNTEIDLSGVFAAGPSVGTAFLDNDNVLLLDPDGNLLKIEISTSDVTTLAFNPRTPIPAISLGDIEYNPEVSPHIFVSIGSFAASVTTNTLYVADIAGNIVNQSGGQTFTDFSNASLGTADETFREIGFDCEGNLFIGTFVNNANRVNVKYLPNASNVAGITGGFGSLVAWHTLLPTEGTSNFSGLDVAAGTNIGSPGSGCGAAACVLPGDLNSDSLINGRDIAPFVTCFIAANGGAPDSGCTCADLAAPSGVLTTPDVTAFVAALLQ